MSTCKERAFDLLKRMSFERIAGSKEEYACAKILEEECKKAGIDVTIEEFEIDAPIIEKAVLKISKPFEMEFNCIGIGKSGSTLDEGIYAEVVYVENVMDANLLDVKGKIALVTGVEVDARKRLIEYGAVGYILIHGSLFDSEEMISEIRTRNIRKKEDDVNLPGVVMHIVDAQKLLRLKPTEVCMILKQDENHKETSHNVIATIPGTKKPDEIITFSAHYDSVIYSSGAWDNATGSVTIMELMHYFNENKPDRTLKFIWCGSEEIGLIGSYSYCVSHIDELKNVLFNINVDMTGTLLGYDIAVCSCEEAVSEYINFLGKLEGFAIKSRVDMYSSDSSSFAVHNIPAVTFARISPRGGAEIHSRHDVLDHLDSDKFIDTVNFMAKFSKNLVNSKVFPVSKNLPKELNEKLDGYKKRFGMKNENKKEEIK